MTKVHEYKVGVLNANIIIDMELRVLECCQYSLSLNSGLLSSREFFLRYFEIVEAYVEDQMKFPHSQVNYFDDSGLFEGFAGFVCGLHFEFFECIPAIVVDSELRAFFEEVEDLGAIGQKRSSFVEGDFVDAEFFMVGK